MEIFSMEDLPESAEGRTWRCRTRCGRYFVDLVSACEKIGRKEGVLGCVAYTGRLFISVSAQQSRRHRCRVRWMAAKKRRLV